jgi:glycosyltransferase involved in cell wall biosynthesis
MSALRIGLVATLSTPVRHSVSGSVEQLVWLLAREFSALGHDVTVYACGGSDVDGTVVETVPGPYEAAGTPEDWRDAELVNLCRAVADSDGFDILHSHAYLWGLPLEQMSAAAMVHTAHVMPWGMEALVQMYPRAQLTALSRFQWAAINGADPVVVPHGVDGDEFAFHPTADGYLCYIGRFIPEKGVLAAIDVARRAGVPLRLAGPSNDYFENVVAPLVDGDQVSYLGLVSGAERIDLIGNAVGLLHPLASPEPFGLVLIEAMMCGTPVLATARGATVEIVDAGVTGYVATDADDLVPLVPRLTDLDRRVVRREAERRFSARGMAHGYLEVYKSVRAGR